MLQQLVAADLFSLLLVFARIGAAFMVLPCFGETFVSPRVRLLIGLAVTLVLTPAVGASLPALPDQPVILFRLVAGEIVTGLFLGMLARLVVTALHIAGTIIGFQSSLANATVFDPINAQPDSLFTAFLSIAGVVLIFAANLHHVMLLAIADSYTLIRPGAPLLAEAISETGARAVAASFALAMQIAAPMLVVGFVLYIGIGLVNRLMPAMQVFFVALPLQIMLSLAVMGLSLSAGLIWFLTRFEATLLDTFVRS